MAQAPSLASLPQMFGDGHYDEATRILWLVATTFMHTSWAEARVGPIGCLTVKVINGRFGSIAAVHDLQLSTHSGQILDQGYE